MNMSKKEKIEIVFLMRITGQNKGNMKIIMRKYIIHFTIWLIGLLINMFVLEYIPKKSLKKCLKNLEKNGILLFVKTSDCNITAEKISKDFYVSSNEVNILNFKTSEQINKIESIKNENPPALLCTFERVSSFIWGLCLSKKMVRRKNIIFMIMTLFLILGCVFSVSLALTGGIDVIKPIELGVYHILWILISILLPKLSM